jgi:hypothetical protein
MSSTPVTAQPPASPTRPSRVLTYGGRRPATRRRVQLAGSGDRPRWGIFSTPLADLRTRRVGRRDTLRPCPWP